MALFADDKTTRLTASSLAAKTTPVVKPAEVTITSPVYENVEHESQTAGYGTAWRVKYAPGQVVLQSELDAHFAGGTGPTVTSVSPTTVAVAGGTKVTVNGKNLDRATGVTLGGTAGTQVTIVSSKKLTFVTPAKAANAAVPIVVNGAPANSAATNVVVA